MIPENLRYTAEHEWVAPADVDGGHMRVGITQYAQEALGEIVHVELPAPGTVVRAGDMLGEVESTKNVSEIYAPLSGTVVARNDKLDDTPELVNSDPYGAGWLVEIDGSPADLDGLLGADAYRQLTEG